MNKTEIITLLKAQGNELVDLYQKADKTRQKCVGDEIYLRGILEFSNYCTKNCCYCGIRKANSQVTRYRMLSEEIIATARQIEKFKQTTVVLQSGEDPFFTREIIGDIISKIKATTNLAVTLSIGTKSKDDLAYWKTKGLDRYLIRFETNNPQLFQAIHPDDDLTERINCIKDLQALGIETGSGFLIGIPGETLENLAEDILFCTSLNLDMIGVGPFIPHHNTPLGKKNNPFEPEIFYKTIAILRLLNKKANIPATTAFDAIEPNGRNKALLCGANVFMPNSTPKKYRKNYQLYPGKPCVEESEADCAKCVALRIKTVREI